MDYIKRHWIVLIACVLALLLLGAICAFALCSAKAARITGQQTVVLAPQQLTPGGLATLRVITQDFNSGAALPDAEVTVRLEPGEDGKGNVVFRGRTDATGSANVSFAVPEGLDPAQRLVVETSSAVGSDRLEQAVTVRRDFKLLLTTDKPLYQPGQIIHIRSLALSSADLTPADGDSIEFTIEDPKGNKVFRDEKAASDWGIASVDFALADEVNLGVYKIVARLGETESEKTVTVKRYVLPKFRISVETDRPFYLPGQTVTGHLRAEYFFGKPVAQGQVQITGSVYVIERQQVMTLQGATDDQGRFDFQFDLPDMFVGGAPEQGTATFGLEITVIDQAQQAEMTAHTIPVAEQPLLIDAVPESGLVKLGLENIVYILTSTPDGAPAETQLLLEADGKRTELATGRHGLAEFGYVPTDESAGQLHITARDAAGNEATRTVLLEYDAAAEALLLRPERAAYRIGETMHLDAFTTAPSGAVFLDIIREGQVVSTRALDVRDGLASTDIDLDETLFGTLQLHAYKVLSDASMVGDTRLVIVERAADIDLAIAADRDTYRPGDTARLTFQTSLGGQPVAAALGVSAVDESVFALVEQEAGFAKLYFLLQAELLEPKYQIIGFAPADFSRLTEQPAEVRQVQDVSAKAALAKVPGLSRTALAQPRWEKQQAIQAERQAIFSRAAGAILWVVAVLALCGLVVSLVALSRQRVLGRSLGFGLLGLLALAGLTLLIAAPLAMYGMGSEALFVVGGLALLALAALIGLFIYAWREKDTLLRVALLLLLACLLLAAVVGFGGSVAQGWNWQVQLGIAAVGLALLLLGFYLRGVGFGVERKRLPALLSIGFAGLLLLPVFGAAVLALAPSQALMFGAAAPVPQLAARNGMENVVVEKEVMVQAPMQPPVAGEAGGAAQEPPRLRQFFPETLYWNPQAITDEQGRAELEIPIADSITTWRLSALASSQRGELGNATAGLRVFQDFFIDLDLPLYLTQHDEVALPVAVYNYLAHAQTVRLVAEPAEWYELLDEPEKNLTIAENDVEVVYFRIRAAAFGRQRFQVTAWGETMSDAIVKDVQVVPDGKEFRQTASDNLRGPVKQTVAIPAQAIPGTAKVYVKIHPGVVSQVVEGLQGMLQMPFG